LAGSFGENPKEPGSFYGVLFAGFFWQNHWQGRHSTYHRAAARRGISHITGLLQGEAQAHITGLLQGEA
jgi:hypothetical protein